MAESEGGWWGDTVCCGPPCGLVKLESLLWRERVGGGVVRFLWGGGVGELVVESESGWWVIQLVVGW